MKENFPNLAKETVFQEVQDFRESPKNWTPGGTHQDTSHLLGIIKLPKIKDKERILKAAREKETVTCKGVPIRLSADFSKETLQVRRDGKKYSKS